MQQHPCQGEPLFHASRQRLDLRIDFVSQICQFEDIVHQLGSRFHWQSIRGREEMQVFSGGQVFIHAEKIGHVTHLLSNVEWTLAHFDAIHLSERPRISG